MTIYLMMCLNDVIGDKYYTDEEVVRSEIERLNKEYCGDVCGDFWYKTMERN